MNIGIICALFREAHSFTKEEIPPRTPVKLANHDGITLLVSGAGPDNATAATRLLLEQPMDCVFSFGVGGALSSRLTPGTVVLPTTIWDWQGGQHLLDNAYRDALLHSLSTTALSICNDALFCTDTLIDTTSRKQILHERNACGAVDMESAAIVAAATEHGIPAVAVRIIFDTAATDFPPPIADNTGDFGQVNLSGMLPALFKYPSAIPTVIQLARDFSRTKKSMRQTAKHIVKLAGLQSTSGAL
ncbi:MAG: hypothetical protein ACR2P9_04570 [Gammaproteobacteria bacterium]